MECDTIENRNFAAQTTEISPQFDGQIPSEIYSSQGVMIKLIKILGGHFVVLLLSSFVLIRAS